MDDVSVASSSSEASTSNGASSGWESETSEPCKRHSYRGGDTCVKCGASKPTHTPRTTAIATTDSRPARDDERVKTFRTIASMSWMAMGLSVEHILPDRWERFEPLRPVGRVIQYEAAVAGPRIQRAMRQTKLWRPILKLLAQVGPFTELAPLIAPPLLIGLMSFSERMQKPLMPVLLALLIPVMKESAEMAEEQSELIAAQEQFNEKSIGAAMGIVSKFFGDDESDDPQSN